MVRDLLKMVVWLYCVAVSVVVGVILELPCLIYSAFRKPYRLERYEDLILPSPHPPAKDSRH